MLARARRARPRRAAGAAERERVRRTVTCSASSRWRRRTSRPSWTSARRFLEIAERPIKKVPTLRGKTVINLFLEPSTRTRTSFEIAAKRLSADAVNISGSASSTVKGETLLDTARNLEAMAPDVVVHPPRAGGRAAHARQAASTPPSSTPATARTSTRPRRCSTARPSARTRGKLAGLDRRDLRRHRATAASRARTSGR